MVTRSTLTHVVYSDKGLSGGSTEDHGSVGADLAHTLDGSCPFALASEKWHFFNTGDVAYSECARPRQTQVDCARPK